VKSFISDKTSRPRQYIIVIALVTTVSLLCYLFSGFIGYRVTAFILFVTISIIATLFDIFPVLLAATLSAMIWDFFFIPPRFTFHVNSTEDVIMLLMYFVIASVGSVLTFKIRQISKIAQEEEEKAKAVKLYNTLLNSLSHELRTPISTIIGASDNLMNDRNRLSDNNKKELMYEISQAALRLDRQVENLLNMSRLESGFIKAKMDWCDISELIYSVVNQLDDLLKEHTVVVQVAEDMPLVKLDLGLMQQVINNLLTNAAIYTQGGSQIKIKAAIKKDKGNEVLEIDVQDEGNGFPENETEKVFEKFYRLKNSKTGGTGLGLSIVKGLVEAHHGRIMLRNLALGGAKFTIEIPAVTSYIKETVK
jgi:two-component system sensor histidine kinase KdpD